MQGKCRDFLRISLHLSDLGCKESYALTLDWSKTLHKLLYVEE